MTEPQGLATVSERQRQLAEEFRALHNHGIFVMPCAWDVGSAKLMAAAGFAAIGTTSGGVNWRNGHRDYVYAVSRASMMIEYGAMADAVNLPVSGDLENGYGDLVDDVIATITQAIGHGMVGGSIEDQSSSGPGGLISVDLAAERIAAARETADNLLVDFTITARAESFYSDVGDPMADAIDRANRYVEAGADCIFVPGPSTAAEIRQLVQGINAPISVGIGSGGGGLSVTELEEIGVRRVSTGGALPRALYQQVMQAARDILDRGTFNFTNDMIDAGLLEDLLDPAIQTGTDT